MEQENSLTSPDDACLVKRNQYVKYSTSEEIKAVLDTYYRLRDWFHKIRQVPCPHCAGVGSNVEFFAYRLEYENRYEHCYRHTTCKYCQGTGEWMKM